MDDTTPNNAMHTDSAIKLGFQLQITGAEPVMANRSAMRRLWDISEGLFYGRSRPSVIAI